MDDFARKRRQEGLGRKVADFADTIRGRRKELGWSQERLAEEVNRHLPDMASIGQTAVSYWEVGRSIPNPDKFGPLEKALDLEPGTLTAKLFGQMPEVPNVPELMERLERVEGLLEQVLERVQASKEQAG